MFGNKYSGTSIINNGVERDLSRRGKFKGSARVDARRGLGSIEGSVGASSGGSGGFMSGLGKRMSSARSAVGEGFGNAARRAYIGGTTMMDSAEAGMRSGAAAMRQGLGGSLNINMKGFGATSGVATGNPMQRAIGAGARGFAPPIAGAHVSMAPPRALKRFNGARDFSHPGARGFDRPALGTRISNAPLSATRKPGPIMARPNLATKVEMAPPKALNVAIERDKGKNLEKLMEHMKGNKKAYAIGAGVIGLGVLLNGRERRGTSSGSQGLYR